MPWDNVILNRLRRSILLDLLNFWWKSRFSSRKEKYAKKLCWLQLICRQSFTPYVINEPQIFIDISSLVVNDGQTGIHRLVRSVAACVSRMEQYGGYRLSLVYASKYRIGYWHAFEFERKVLGRMDLPEADVPISFKKGDIFYELDWNMKLSALQRPFYEQLVKHDVKVFFNVYDIIPLQLNDLYSPKSQEAFEQWLLEASRYTGVLCNSQAVAEYYREWRQKKGLPSDFVIDWFHLGADIENSYPSKGLPDNADAILDAIRSTTSILMVSSLHPRKGYAQALAAFEMLWNAGHEVKLVIVGKDDPHGGNMAQRLREHPEHGRRLIWLENISDEYLDLIYKASSAVLSASRAEGFGLPVLEGGRYGKPLILRDLPVFRELVGDNATYFSGEEPKGLAEVVARWEKRSSDDKAPKLESGKIQTWQRSIENMLNKLIIHTVVEQRGLQ